MRPLIAGALLGPAWGHQLDRLLRSFVPHSLPRGEAAAKMLGLAVAWRTAALALRRWRAGGDEREDQGRSVAHLRLNIAGTAFRSELLQLRGRRLGCFCSEESECHAGVLAELVAREVSKEAAADVDETEPAAKRVCV